MTIFDKLKFTGIDIGNVQSVNEMTVVPILGDSRGEIASPTNLKFQRTSDYGSMVFNNEDEHVPAIVPTNMMVRGQGAQDHAMASSGIIQAGKVRHFQNACCIEQSQGGYLNSTNNEEDVLPVNLRRALLRYDVRIDRSYDKLWGDISDWLRGLNLQSASRSAHLRYFYDTPDVKDALEVFAAEFEPVDGQIGAIIMFNGVPVGIEIMPSSEHWEAYWKLLIRGCYGAEMLRLKMLGKLKNKALILPDIPNGSTPDDVKQIFDNFSLHLRKEVVPILEKIDVKAQKSFYTVDNLETTLIQTSTGGGGDMIKQGNVPVYLSLII
jgi:hypothetical protein